MFGDQLVDLKVTQNKGNFKKQKGLNQGVNHVKTKSYSEGINQKATKIKTQTEEYLDDDDCYEDELE